MNRKTQLAFRRGYTYIAVMMTAVAVASLAMSSAWIAREIHLEQTAADEAFELASEADSAIELALARIATNSSWRETHVHNTEYGPFALGNVNLFYRLLDRSGNIGTGRLRDITVIGIARRGSSSYAVQVDATPAGSALTCLNHGIAVDSNSSLSYRTTWVTNGGIYSKGNISLEWEASMTGPIQSSGTISGVFLNGTLTARVAEASFANASTLQRYVAEATNIPISSLPRSSSNIPQFRNCLLSPNHNPFGGNLNSNGVYRIDCQNLQIQIENCRILGTLILENIGTDSRLNQNVLIQPAVPNYPSLLINGTLRINSRWGNFSEATLGVNLNPSGAPYQGLTNDTTTDIYPARIEGIYYCFGETYFMWQSELEVEGIFVSSSLNLNESASSLRVNYDAAIASNPPPGFRQDTRMLPIRGTYRRIATP